jgi:WD40 repeat protein
MGTDESLRPPSSAWVAAVHATETDFRPLGAGVVIDASRVLTCAHVLAAGGALRERVWVAFPNAAGQGYARRAAVVQAADYVPPVRDLAVLVLDEPVPAGMAARVLCPASADLVGRRWWAFGFPGGDPVGDAADGVVGESLSYGWLRLDPQSRSGLALGFSGGGLWSPDFAAVVGLVGQYAGSGAGRAVSLFQADLALPGEKLALLAGWRAAAAGEAALAAWGWSLAADPEGIRHWRPRARGVSVDSERGFRFRGRGRALTRITEWLVQPAPDRKILVVTGSPGVGKSAVLGRIVTTADIEIRESLPTEDDGVMAEPGSVACAVHAKSKIALDVAAEIARAASARLPAQPGDLAPAVREALERRGGQRFNVIIDALDEAASPAQAREIITKVVLPLAETCSGLGAQVIAGTRRSDAAGSLLAPFADALAELDLDDPEYFDEGDLAAYAVASLRLAGDERPGNPYDDEAVAWSTARAIALLADGNFLVAGLVARDHGLHDRQVAAPAELGFGATLDDALRGYLDRTPDVSAGLSAAHALTALAFAESPGLPGELWRLAIQALYGVEVPARDLTGFARTAAASFLIESGAGPDRQPVFRLFHQGLNDALARARAAVADHGDDERALTLALAAHGRRSDWQDAPGYLLRSLPGHAAAAGLIDDLLADDAYLLHVDLHRLILVGGQAATAHARRRIQLIGLTPEAFPAGSAERAAMFSVTQALEGMDVSYRAHPGAPYHARWAEAMPRGARTVLESHQGEVSGVCTVTVAGQDLLASAGGDGTIRVWDPATGQQRATLEGHQGEVPAVCAVTVAGRHLLASGGRDGTVRIWDPATGQQLAVLQGHQGTVRGVCAVTVTGHELLASAGESGTIRIWDPATGQQLAVLQGHEGPLAGVCALAVTGHQLLASAGRDGTVRIWDPVTGQQRVVLEGHRDWVAGVCAVTVAGRHLVASAGEDGTVRIWDPRTGMPSAVLQGHRDWVSAVCAVTVAGQRLLASASFDGTIRVWDPGTGQRRTALSGHQGPVTWVCGVTAAGQQTLASASYDGTIRIWDPATGQQSRMLRGHHGWVNGVCAVTVAGRQLLASAGADKTVRIWDPVTGQQRAVLQGHGDWVSGVCAVTVAGQELLASAGEDGTVRIWDPATGQQRLTMHGHQGEVSGVCAVTVAGHDLLASAGRDGTVRIRDPVAGLALGTLQGHRGWVRGVCAVTVAGHDLLASAGEDGTIRIWDPATGQQRAALSGHQGPVTGVSGASVAGQRLLASTGADQTVRIWDPDTTACLLVIPVHHRALAAAWVGDSLVVALAAGILMLVPNIVT